MPLDPSIILQAGKGIVPLKDPTEIADEQAQRQMRQLQLQTAQRGMQDDQTYRQTLMNTPTDQLPGALYKAGLGPQAQAAQKFQTEQQKAQSDRGAAAAKGMADGANQILANPTEQNAISVLESTAQTHALPQQMVDNAKAQIYAARGDSAKIKQLAGGWGADATKVLGSVTNVNLGGTEQTQQVNPFTQQVSVLAQQARTASPDTIMSTGQSAANNAATIKNQQLINGIGADGAPTGDVEAMAKSIADGKLAPLSGFSLAKPRGQAIMARVMELNPSYDAGDFAAKNAALKGFATGKEGTALRSFNVASDHLDTLGQMADALNNKDTQILNRIGNAWNQQTGSPAPTNFNAVKEIVGKEVVKAIVAGGGGVAEREEMSRLMDAANSPAQLKGVITHFKELMDAQKSGLMDQYQRTTGRTDGATVFAPSKKEAPAPLQLGTRDGGFIYKGGDPKSPSSWEKEK